ncbi:MAG: lamin tail domain-containing protein, partial [Bacteroidia bacterium]
MKKALLAVFALGLYASANAQISGCTELFISEYVEGSSHSKALEIYNPTSASVNLSNYRLVRYSNGSPTGVDSITLSGTLASLDVSIVVNGQATPDANGAFCDPILLAMGDIVGPAQYANGTAVMYFNGDDAIVLARIQPYAIVDIFGKIGEDPGVCWTDVFPFTSAAGAYWTRDHAMPRKPAVTGGVTVNPSAFDPTLEYDSLPENT